MMRRRFGFQVLPLRRVPLLKCHPVGAARASNVSIRPAGNHLIDEVGSGTPHTITTTARFKGRKRSVLEHTMVEIAEAIA